MTRHPPPPSPVLSGAQTPPTFDSKIPSVAPNEKETVPLTSDSKSEPNASAPASAATESAASISEPTLSNQMQEPAPPASPVDSQAGPDASTNVPTAGVTESADLVENSSSTAPSLLQSAAPLPQPPATVLSSSSSTGPQPETPRAHAGSRPATSSARGAGARAGAVAVAGRTCDHELEQSEDARVSRLLKTRALFNTLERLDARQHATLIRERQRVQKCLISIVHIIQYYILIYTHGYFK